MRDGLTDELYGAVDHSHDHPGFTDRERLAAEYAERFAYDHQRLDDEFWARMSAAFSDQEIVELSVTIGHCLGIGRVLQVLDVERDFDVNWAREPGGNTSPPADADRPPSW